jgi:serine/threonine protein kinase/tetratricopeptide (TPR) repeat protein
MPLAAGTQVGDYRLLALIGSGAMGDVYRAHDLRLDRDVAIKALPAEFACDADRLARFEQEARALAALSHPNIVTIYAVHVENGTPFLVMELVEGETLRQHLHDTPPAPRRAVEIAAAIASALAAAHAHGVVHRDLKPENVLVTGDGQVKVVDFGLARTCVPIHELATAAAAAPMTQPGVVLGTPAYMAPEQVRGERVDHRADIFAFGCVLYEILGGRPVFARGSPAEAMTAVLRDHPPDLPPAGGPEIHAIVLRCLEKQPELRFQSAADLAFTLRTHLPDSDGRRSSVVRQPVAADKPAIAVLPFLNLSADPDQDYFCDGVAEEVINALAHVDGLRVLARSSSFSFKGMQQDVREIGARLGVGLLVEGSVRRSGSRLRITAQLVSASDGSHLWSERYDRRPEDVFAIQDEIALAVVENLSVRLLAPERAIMKRRPAASLAAYDAYLKGLFHWEQLSPEGLARSIECFEDAIRLDPELAPAYVFLSQSHGSAAFWADAEPRAALKNALPLVERALEIQPYCAEAHAARGILKLYFERDSRTAEESFREAVRLAPSLAFGHLHLCGWNLIVGNRAEAIAEACVTLRLDPVSPANSAFAACWMGFAGEIETAVGHLERIAASSTTFWMPHYLLAAMLPPTGRLAEARQAAETAVRLSGGASAALGVAGAIAYRRGDTARGDECRGLLQHRAAAGYASPSPLAWVEFARGDGEAGRRALQRAADAGDPMLLFCPFAVRSLLPAGSRRSDDLAIAASPA